MRSAPLTVIKGGINRQRLRFGIRADVLYDLVNGYVTDAGTVVARPGTIRETVLPEETRGLVSFAGNLHTFCHEPITVPAGYVLHVLAHPDAVLDYPVELSQIHYVTPFMGALYVVAEFIDGAVFHYWLQGADEWEPDKHYRHGALVSPTDPNGLVYRAGRLGDPYPAWTPNTPRYDGTQPGYEQSIIEPTVYNDFYYTCEQASGNNPRSGTVEPVWPLEVGAQVTEQAEGTGTEVAAAPPVPPSADTPSPDVLERYLNIFTRRGA